MNGQPRPETPSAEPSTRSAAPRTRSGEPGLLADGYDDAALISHALDEALTPGRARALLLGGEFAELWEALTTATEGGKRFRPALLMTTYRALGGRQPALAARVGAAVELLHTAFVIHDDVIDGDETRRGRPNVAGTLAGTARAVGVGEPAAAGYGRAAGILAGDLALAAAVRQVATAGAPPQVTARLLDLVDDALSITAAGELDDVALTLRPVTGPSAAHGPSAGGEPAGLHEVLVMQERKTAAYSFTLPLQAAAILAGAGEDLIGGLAEVGRLLGVAFQLLDDLQGVFGDEAVTGKSALSDLREGKCTPLIVHARATDTWAQLAPLIGDPQLTGAQAARARQLLVACGARDAVEALAREHLDAALTLAADLDLPDEVLTWMATLGAGLMRRAA